MLRRIKLLIMPFLFSGFLFSDEYTDIVTKVGTCAGNWLKLETGTRAIGMGGAHVAAGDGIYAVPYNPASIGFIDRSDTFFSTTNYVAGITHSVLGYATKQGESNFIGFHMFYMDSGKMDVTTVENPNGFGEEFSVKAFSLRGIYTKILTDRLKIGFAVKYIREQIYTTYMQSFVVDLGSNFDTGLYGMVLGMSVSNFGPQVEYSGEGLEIEVDLDLDPDEKLSRITNEFYLPLTFRLGIKNDIIGPNSSFIDSGDLGVHKLTLALDAINALDYTVYSTMGLEYSWKNMAFARFGAHFGHDTAGMSFGVGLKYQGIDADIAYVDYGHLNNSGALGGTLQFGVGLDF